MAFIASSTVWAHRASAPDYNNPHTETFWVRRTATTGAGMFVVGNTPINEEDLLEMAGGASVFPVASGNGSFGVGAQTFLTQDVWYFLALRRASATALELYLGTVSTAAALIATVTYNPTARAAASYLVLGARSVAGSSTVSAADYDSAKAWSVALSAAEIEAERLFEAPQRTANLWASWPLQADGSDASGNSRPLTVTGTPSYTAGPTITREVAARARGMLVVAPSLPFPYMEV